MTYKIMGICLVYLSSLDEELDVRGIDMGNYYKNEETGEVCLITRRELAEKYGHLVKCPVYVWKNEQTHTEAN